MIANWLEISMLWKLFLKETDFFIFKIYESGLLNFLVSHFFNLSSKAITFDTFIS